MSDAHQAEMSGIVGELVRRQRDQDDALLAALPIGASMCVHEEPPGQDWRPDRDVSTFTTRAKAHMLAPGESCYAQERRTQYGPMTAEIQAQAERMGL